MQSCCWIIGTLMCSPADADDSSTNSLQPSCDMPCPSCHASDGGDSPLMAGNPLFRAEVLKVTDDSLSAFPRVWRKADDGNTATLPEEDIVKAAPTSKSVGAHPSKKFVLVSMLLCCLSTHG